MKLYELLNITDVNEVIKFLHINYDTVQKIQDEGFLLVWLRLFTLEPVSMENIIKVEVIHISDDKDSTDDQGNIIPWYDTYGLSKEGIKYAIELSDWDEWLGLEVSNPQNLNINNFLSHVLWEMTFFGFDQQNIKNIRDDLKNQVDEIELMKTGKIPNTLKSFASVEELFADLELDDKLEKDV